MALDPLVNNVQIKDTFEFDKRGSPVAVMIYSYFIGPQGPFQSKFYAAEQQPDHIARVIGDRVALLRQQGVVS